MVRPEAEGVRTGSSDGCEVVGPEDDSSPRRVPGARKVQRGAHALKRHYTDSSAEHVWTRLNAMDFINKGMLFAAILLLCFFPFLIVANALAGRSAVTGMVRRFGLNQQAASDVSHVFASSQATSSSITGAGYVLFVLGGLAAATAVQDLYERAYGLPSRGIKDMPRQAVWLAVVVGFAVLAGWAGPHLGDAGGPVLLGLIGLVALVAFWWFTMWFLLAGRVSARGRPLRGRDRHLLGGDGARLPPDVLQHRDLRLRQVRRDRRRLRAHVVADRDRSGDHPRCDRRGGLARPRPLVRGSLQAAAEAQRADLSYAKTTVRAPLTSTRSSRCQRKPCASTVRSMSRPIRTRSSTDSAWPTAAVS